MSMYKYNIGWNYIYRNTYWGFILEDMAQRSVNGDDVL